MPVHVSIHDVSPAWSREVEEALAICHDAGARPALLVVPDFHGKSPLLADDAFCARLRALQSDGHEMYLHGFYHRSRPRTEEHPTTGVHLPARKGESPPLLRWLFAQRIASGGEAEFADVSRIEAIERLGEGERVFERAGLTPDGFVAPAWSMPRWLLPILAERGYRFTEDHLRIYDPVMKRSRPSVVLNYASRTRARMLSTIVWCRIAKHARAVVPARIAIHPADLRVPILAREVRRLLAWGAGDFVPRGDALFASS